MLPRKQAIKRCFIFPPILTSASALPGEMKKDKNSILSLKCCTVPLPDYNQLLTAFIQCCCLQLSGEVLAWLSVWSEVQMICIWSTWCHYHPIISCSSKIQNGVRFWCRLSKLSWKKAFKRMHICLVQSCLVVFFCFYVRYVSVYAE